MEEPFLIRKAENISCGKSFRMIRIGYTMSIGNAENMG